MVVPEPSVAPEPSAAATAVEPAPIVVATPVMAAPVVTAPAAPVETVVVHVPRRGPAHVVRRWTVRWTMRWTVWWAVWRAMGLTVRGRACVVSTRTWTWKKRHMVLCR